MTKENTHDERPLCEAPKALRLEDMHRGEGICSSNGSGDNTDCYSLGIGASGSCLAGT